MTVVYGAALVANPRSIGVVVCPACVVELNSLAVLDGNRFLLPLILDRFCRLVRCRYVARGGMGRVVLEGVERGNGDGRRALLVDADVAVFIYARHARIAAFPLHALVVGERWLHCLRQLRVAQRDVLIIERQARAIQRHVCYGHGVDLHGLRAGLRVVALGAHLVVNRYHVVFHSRDRRGLVQVVDTLFRTELHRCALGLGHVHGNAMGLVVVVAVEALRLEMQLVFQLQLHRLADIARQVAFFKCGASFLPLGQKVDFPALVEILGQCEGARAVVVLVELGVELQLGAIVPAAGFGVVVPLFIGYDDRHLVDAVFVAAFECIRHRHLMRCRVNNRIVGIYLYIFIEQGERVHIVALVIALVVVVRSLAHLGRPHKRRQIHVEGRAYALEVIHPLGANRTVFIHSANLVAYGGI